jgi:hypothetical protein
LVSSGDGPAARCTLCGAAAVGPCARCHSLVCGDCCELTEGGATTFAVCNRCVRAGGASLSPAWLGLLAWVGLIVLGLVGIVVVIVLLRR